VVDGHRADGGVREHEAQRRPVAADEFRDDGHEIVAVGAQAMEPDDGPGRRRPGLALDAVQQHGNPRGDGRAIMPAAPAAGTVTPPRPPACEARTVARPRTPMPTTTPLVWELTIALIVGLLVFDYVFHVRKAHEPGLREAAVWSALYVGIALLFGVAVWTWGGADMGAEYFSGYITEKALSVDNVFVFLVIMTSFQVPRASQQKVLLVGITFALVARTVFILLGAALIERFAWVFYIFGLLLLLTAGNLLAPDGHDADRPNIVVRMVRAMFHSSPHYDGDRLFTTWQGKRALTPMLLVMLAIGGTDILFAFDSIPAIFGLTQNVFIVFTATAFSLLGLRQLYFLVGGLLERLVYLSIGLR